MGHRGLNHSTQVSSTVHPAGSAAKLRLAVPTAKVSKAAGNTLILDVG